MKLSIIVCTYNERPTIQTVLDRIQAVDFGPDVDTEILVIDNCSTDGTRDILKTITAPNIKVIYQPQNMGKGMSIRTGIDHMTGDYGVIQDADLEYHPNELPKLLVEALKHDHLTWCVQALILTLNWWIRYYWQDILFVKWRLIMRRARMKRVKRLR
jgi:glycosyltransferase involved in cell wall biosynthesis